MKFALGNVIKRHFMSTRLSYEIPEEYHNSFYLANASLLQIVNYFVHSSHKAIFPELIELVRDKLNCAPEEAALRVRACIARLDRCEAGVDAHIHLRRSFRDWSLIKANRVYHGVSFYDKCLGGFRFNDELTRHNSKGFAAQQTYRNALFGIEMGGAAGGIRFCPFVLNVSEMNEVLQQFLAKIPKYRNLTDLLEPDVGSSAIEMDILKSHQELAPHVEILGKTEAGGGLKDHMKASGKCAIQSVKRFLENEKIAKTVELSPGLSGKTYILQGLGKVGKEIALMMHKEGAECIGVREHDCVLYEPAGIHVKALFKHIHKYGTMRLFKPNCRENDLDSIFTQPCDILILSAMERCVSCNIADRVQAKVLVEVANLPISPTAYKILANKQRLVVPGLIAGAGPSLMSYYEHRMNSAEDKIDPQNVPALFDAALQTAIDDVINVEDKIGQNFNFLEAAYIRAIRNIFKRAMTHHIMLADANQKMIGMQ